MVGLVITAIDGLCFFSLMVMSAYEEGLEPQERNRKEE